MQQSQLMEILTSLNIHIVLMCFSALFLPCLLLLLSAPPSVLCVISHHYCLILLAEITHKICFLAAVMSAVSCVRVISKITINPAAELIQKCYS